ncbi:hypothetical protein FB451DRAFT_1416501 [Mycena latifolia]|nr:hypothetical protein FB451DRAFT_1416501 [Mycena latifolia]
MQSLPSPPTSHEFIYEEEEGQGSSGDEPAVCKPSYPVLLALAPPVGNWLIGGDHLRDALLLLLLVFYLHQLIEVPWRLYHAACPRLPSSPAVAGPPTCAAARAAFSLRALELLLLLLCLAAPPLGALLLRAFLSPASSPSGSAPSTVPLSWFSTTLLALLASFRPLRELMTQAAGAARGSAPPPPPPPASASVLTSASGGSPSPTRRQAGVFEPILILEEGGRAFFCAPVGACVGILVGVRTRSTLLVLTKV